MRPGPALRRRIFFLLSLALTFSLAACDLGGSNSSPDWVDTWKSSDSEYWDLSKEKIEKVTETLEGCHVTSSEIVDYTNNSIRFRDPAADTIDGVNSIIEYKLEPSKETMEVTVLEHPLQPESVGNEFTLEETLVDKDAQDILNCEQ